MFPEQRYQLIQKQVEETGFVSVEQLQELTGCSAATIRRDMSKMIELGNVRRAIGGIVPASASDMDDPQSSFTTRVTVNREEKARVGIAAQQLIESGDILFIHGGTTCFEVARHIGRDKNLTVITDHLGIASVLRKNPRVELILLGGKLGKKQQLLSGPVTIRTLEFFNPNKTIMGAGGISLEKGVTNFDYYGAEIEQRIVELAKELIFVLDHTKFCRDVLCQISPINKIGAIVTNTELDERIVAQYRELNINVILG